MRFKKSSLQHLIDSIPLAEHLKKTMTLKRSGANWLGLCPFHEDSTPSFYVYPTNYHCFACHAHGSVLNYELHRTGLSFQDCVQQLASQYQIPLEYEKSEWDEKKRIESKIQSQQLDLMMRINAFFKGKKEQPLSFTDNEKSLFSTFYFSDLSLKESIFHPLFSEKYSSQILHKENGEPYGLFFYPKKQDFNQRVNIYYLTINKSFSPCLYWNEARPFAVKEKNLVVVFDVLDARYFYEKNISNVVVCFKEIDISLMKLFAKRVPKITLVVSQDIFGKRLLWKTFLNSLQAEDLSFQVLMLHENRVNRDQFFQILEEKKIRKWLDQSEKIYTKITQIFLDSLGQDIDKYQAFQKKLLPLLQKIKDVTLKKAILMDISNRFFHSNVQSVPELRYGENTKFKPENPVKYEKNEQEFSKKETATKPIQPILEVDSELYSMMERAAEFYHHFLLKNGAEALSYLAARGLTLPTIKKWKIGFCSPENELGKKAQRKLILPEKLESLGLIKRQKYGDGFYDFFRDRITIPIADTKGRFVALSGRVFKAETDTAKYINSPESLIFSKSKILFNFHRAMESISISQGVLVVEGYMDCIALVEAGISNVVAVMGTALTHAHFQEIRKFTKRVVLCFDADKAGQAASKRTYFAGCEFADLELEYLALPDCKDPDEFIRKYGREAFLELLNGQKPLVFEMICDWCFQASRDNQEFVQNLLNTFSEFSTCANEQAPKQVKNYLWEKYQVSVQFPRMISSREKPVQIKEQSQPEGTGWDCQWPAKNPLEMKLLLSLVDLSFDDLPSFLQEIMMGAEGMDPQGERLCVEAIQHQFSKVGFEVFVELSAWMIENRSISVSSLEPENFQAFSIPAQILLGYSVSDLKTLFRYNLQELLKDVLSSGISMVLSQNVWNLKNSGYFRFLLRNIKLAKKNGVLGSLFEEALLKLEVDYIDSILKAHTSLHFDNELDVTVQQMVAARVRCKTQLGKIGSI